MNIVIAIKEYNFINSYNMHVFIAVYSRLVNKNELATSID